MTTVNDDLTFDTRYSEFNNVEETYSMLFSVFENGLENNIDYFLNNNIDYLSMILEKINHVKRNKTLNSEEASQLSKAKSELFSVIEKKLHEQFSINLEYEDIDRRNILATAYNFFYTKKRENTLNFLCNYIIAHRKQYINQYKNLMNKDITFNQIKNELELENSTLYPLIYFYDDIVTTLIECDIIPISNLFNQSEISFAEVNILSTLFENSDQIKEYNNFFKGLASSAIFPDFLLEFRNMFISKLIKLP
jgi:hypothetical protein